MITSTTRDGANRVVHRICLTTAPLDLDLESGLVLHEEPVPVPVQRRER